jgi:sulfate adenylyltransferase subunit 2
MRGFPLAYRAKLAVWEYILIENIAVVALYFSKERRLVGRDGVLIMLDDERLPLRDSLKA